MKIFSNCGDDSQWSEEIRQNRDNCIGSMHPDGASISVMFTCTKCGKRLIVDGIDLPSYGIGDTAEDTRVWGEDMPVECECGAEYDVVIDNSCCGWDVEIERSDTRDSKQTKPKSFRYRIDEDYVAEYDDDSDLEQWEDE